MAVKYIKSEGVTNIPQYPTDEGLTCLAPALVIMEVQTAVPLRRVVVLPRAAARDRQPPVRERG